MVNRNPLLGKLFGSMAKQKICRWEETKGKRAKRQAGFRAKYSTIDHNVTLRFLVEKIRNNQGVEAFRCSMGFKKASNTVPRDKLWDRIEELEILKELNAALYRLYGQVKAKIRTRDGMSKHFGSNIRVKWGYLLAPTLFGLYINDSKEWLNKANGKRVQLSNCVIECLCMLTISFE